MRIRSQPTAGNRAGEFRNTIVRYSISIGRWRIGGDAGEHALDPLPLRRKRARPGGGRLHERHQNRLGRRRAAGGVADYGLGLAHYVRGPWIGRRDLARPLGVSRGDLR